MGRWGYWTDFKTKQRTESGFLSIQFQRRNKHLCPNEPKHIVSYFFFIFLFFFRLSRDMIFFFRQRRTFLFTTPPLFVILFSLHLKIEINHKLGFLLLHHQNEISSIVFLSKSPESTQQNHQFNTKLPCFIQINQN